jgi:hypothetical protein
MTTGAATKSAIQPTYGTASDLCFIELLLRRRLLGS